MSAVSPISTRTGRVIPQVVLDAVQELVTKFDAGDYNPTPVVDLGALVANADGHVDPQELDALCAIFEPLLGAELDRELVSMLVDASVQVAQAAGSPARIRVIAEILNDCDAVEPALIVALSVAFASDGLSDAERSVITAIARATETSDARLAELTERVRKAFAS